MESLTARLRTPPAQEDHFATIRRRNKQLIIAFFVLIFAVAVITGTIIVFLIRKHKLEPQPEPEISKPNPAIREYCYDFQLDCISFLSYSIHATRESTPPQILRFSLETATRRIASLLTQIHDSNSSINPRFEPTIQSCSSLLRDSMSQLNNTVTTMGSDPDEETRMAVLEEITAAWNNLKQCLEALESVLLTAVGEEMAALYLIKDEVYDTKSLVGYGRNFLLNFDMVNENFKFVDLQISERWSRVIEDLSVVTLFGVYYSVLVFLFCLLLRIH